MSLLTFSFTSALRVKSIFIFLISLYGMLVLFFEQTCIFRGLSPILKTDRLNNAYEVYLSDGGANSVSVRRNNNSQKIRGFNVDCTLVESIGYKDASYSQEITKLISKEIENEKWLYNYTFINSELSYANVMADSRLFYSLDDNGEFEFNAALNLSLKSPCFMTARMTARKEVCKLPSNFSFNYFIFCSFSVLFYCLMCGLSYFEKNIIRKMMLMAHSFSGDISGFEFCNEYTKRWTKYYCEPHYIRAFDDLLTGQGLDTAFISGSLYRIFPDEVFISDGVKPKQISLKISGEQYSNLLKYVRALNISNKNCFQSNGHSYSLEEVINFYNSDPSFYIGCEENFTGEAKTPDLVEVSTFNDIKKSCPKRGAKTIYVVLEHFKRFMASMRSRTKLTFDDKETAIKNVLVNNDGEFFLIKILNEGFKANSHNSPSLFNSSQWKMYLSDIWKISETHKLGIRRPSEIRKNTRSLDEVLAMKDDQIELAISMLTDEKSKPYISSISDCLENVEFMFFNIKEEKEKSGVAPGSNKGKEGEVESCRIKEPGKGVKPSKRAEDINKKNLTYLMKVDYVCNEILKVSERVDSSIETFKTEKSAEIEEFKSKKRNDITARINELRGSMKYMSKKEKKKAMTENKMNMPPEALEKEIADLSNFEAEINVRKIFRDEIQGIRPIDESTVNDKCDHMPVKKGKETEEAFREEEGEEPFFKPFYKMNNAGEAVAVSDKSAPCDYTADSRCGELGVSSFLLSTIYSLLEFDKIKRGSNAIVEIGLEPPSQLELMISKRAVLDSIDHLEALQVIDLIYLYKFSLLLSGGKPADLIEPIIKNAESNLKPGARFLPLLIQGGESSPRCSSKASSTYEKYKEMPLGVVFSDINDFIRKEEEKKIKYYKKKTMESLAGEVKRVKKRGKGNLKKSEMKHLNKMEKGVKVASFLLAIHTMESKKCFSKNKVLMRVKEEKESVWYRCSNSLVKTYTKAIKDSTTAGRSHRNSSRSGAVTDRLKMTKSRLLYEVSSTITGLING